MKIATLALIIAAFFCVSCKYSDLSDSFTDLLLSLPKNGGFNDFQGKLGSLASNIDSKTSSNDQVQNSVIDFFSALEK